MANQIHPNHNPLHQYICAKNDCVQLTTRQSVVNQEVQTAYGIAVKLSISSRQFFLKWTEYVLQKLGQFKQIVEQMGYSKIFQMKLSANHPKGTVSQLSFQDIQIIILQALDEHRKIIEGNLNFIGGTKMVSQMVHPEFLKDLFNLVAQDARMNLQNLPNIVQRKLIQSFPTKQIYKYANFPICSKEIVQMQAHRRSLLQQYQELIVLRTQINEDNKNKPLPNITINQTQPSKNTLSVDKSNKLGNFSSSNYHSSSQSQLPDLNNQQQKKQKKQVDGKIQDGNANESIQQLKTTIALLRSNEIMYRDKIGKLEGQNNELQLQIKRLQSELQKVKQSLQSPIPQSNESLSTVNKRSQQLQLQIQKQQFEQQINQLNSTISQLYQTQQKLIQQNKHLTQTKLNTQLQQLLKQKQSIIQKLQQQIKSLHLNIQFKQKSIVQLNQLISNEQEEITYRQNQVEILQNQIKKLMNKIEFLQKSVHQLNNLISNQEEEIAYRQNQVQTLGEEINKLLKKIKDLQNSISSLNHLIANEQEEIAYRENQSEILEKEVQKLLSKISYLEKSIHQLNNLIANEEEQIAYRQNQSQTLSKEVHKLLDKNRELQRELRELKEMKEKKEERIQPNQELLEQVVVMEADLASKSQDIYTLVNVVQKLLAKVETVCKQFDKQPFLDELKRLMTVSASFQ